MRYNVYNSTIKLHDSRERSALRLASFFGSLSDPKNQIAENTYM